jgi:AraC-like DNA-binding protein
MKATHRPLLRATYTIGQADVRLSADRPVHAQRLSVAEDVGAHDHAYHEVCLVIGGGALHVTSDYERPLLTGSVVVVPPGLAHAFVHVQPGFGVINVYYLAEWLAADLLWQQAGLVPLFLASVLFPAAVVPQFALPGTDVPRVEHELDDLAIETDRDDPSPVFARAAWLKAMAILGRAAVTSGDGPIDYAFRPEVWTTIQAIEKLVGVGEPLDVSSLADRAALSADHLTRLFRTATGCRLGDYYQAAAFTTPANCCSTLAIA